MIVDDLRAALPGLRSLPELHTFRVPWQVAPKINGDYFEWTQEFPEKMIPRNADNSVDSSWWRPPFKSMAIASEQSEDGIVFVLTLLPSDWESIWYNKPDEKANALFPAMEWSAFVGLVVKNQGHPYVVCATQVYSVAGQLHDVDCKHAESAARLFETLTGMKYNSAAPLYQALKDEYSQREKGHKSDISHLLATFVTTMSLLSCKNVQTDQIKPPEKVQAKRKQRGNLPLVSYHVLKVGGLTRKRSGDQTKASGEPLALHWVRGHFKTFTADAPLLGRHIGTYWWGPHTAGKADRVVHKSYEVKR